MPRQIRYTRHEFHGAPEAREAPLTIFIYDVPHLAACGVLPPLHILNTVLLAGETGGGMGPGASWESFAITLEEYSEMLATVATQTREEVCRGARYGEVQYVVDPSLDHFEDRLAWVAAVAKAHGTSYRARLQAPRPYDIVRVARLRDSRFASAEAGHARAPRVGDTGTVLEVYEVPERAYEVECSNSTNGQTIWLEPLYAEELELVEVRRA